MEDLNLPWLDEGFVADVLRNSEKDKTIQVSSVTVTLGTPRGTNLTTDIYRISFKISRIFNGENITEARSLMIKVGSYDPSNSFKKMMMDCGVFETETWIFMEILPLMNQILTESGMEPLSPRCLDANCTKEPIYIVIEDLMPRGFRLAANLYDGLDLEHCLLAIRNLAVFHATSVAIVDKDPMAPLTKRTKGLCHKDRPAVYATRMILSVKALAKEVSKWSELSPRISDKIAKLPDFVHQKAYEAVLFRKDNFNVLNHGDFSQVNIMFRYDEHQKPIDIKFIDFQVSHYGSPAVDLLHFFGLAVNDEVRFNHRDLLLREYHDSLTSTMNKLKCRTAAPSFDDLQKVLIERGFYEVIISFTVFSLARCPQKSTEPTESDGTYDGPPLYKYGGQSYRKIMSQLLPLYDKRGFLDL